MYRLSKNTLGSKQAPAVIRHYSTITSNLDPNRPVLSKCGGHLSPRAVHQCKQVSIFNYTRTWSHVMGADQELRSSTWDCKYIRCHPPPLLTWTVKWRKTSVCFCKTLSPQNMKTIFNELEYPIYNWSLNRQKYDEKYRDPICFVCDHFPYSIRTEPDPCHGTPCTGFFFLGVGDFKTNF